MHTRHSFSRLYSVCILLILFCFLCMPVHADSDARTVRVAFPEQEGMSFIGHSGKVTGYNYDYLQKISEYTGWQLEFISYPNSDGTEAVMQAMQDLQDGKVDLLGPILKNEQTEALFDFPENSYGTVYTTLCTANSSILREGNFKSQHLIHIGLWTQAKTRNQETITYMDAENIPYEISYYDTSDEQLDALKSGEVDVIPSVSLSPVPNTRIVAQFAARPYYFATTKGNTQLTKELDDTISRINQIQPYLQDSLFSMYFRNAEDEFTVSDSQRESLKQTGTLQILCIDHDAPYVYQKDGSPAGMLVSILEDFAQEMEFSLNYTFCQNQAEAKQLLDNHTYDILIGMPFTSQYCAKNGFVQSEPVIVSSLAYARSPYNEQLSSVAIVKGLESLLDTSSFSDVQLYDTASACIQAVADGHADLAAGDRSVLEYYIYEKGSSLTTSLISGETQQVCLAVSRNCSSDFATVLNNYIYSLSDAEKTGYLSAGNLHSSQTTITTLIRQHPVTTVFVLCLLTALIAISIFAFFYARQMQKKNRELKIASESKTEFLTHISHDIRTPMNGIIGMLDMADRYGDDPEKIKSCHDRIRVASDYLLSLINDVLDMNRMESEQICLDDRSLDLRQTILSCIDITQNRASQAGIRLETDTLDSFYPPQVFASEQHLRQILLNLISNAIKYNCPGGSVTVKAAVTAQTADTVTCCFTVSDTGIGMSREFQKRMFEPFAQENNDARSQLKGSGLGLSIVKKIVDFKHGTIQVDSTQGKGTIISVTLTFSIDPLHTAPEAKENPHGADISGMKILAAEDNDMNAELLQMLLEDAGAAVTLVHDGQQLVAAFTDAAPGTYDCILTDIMMPVLDGYEATRQIRALNREDASVIPIIALTANAFAEDARRALDAGMNAHITKPINMKELCDCLCHVAR